MNQRLVSFQFPSRFGPRSIRFQFDTGQAPHKTVLSFIQAGKFYESDISNFLLQTLEPGDWSVDVGANLGYHSLLMGALVGTEGKIFSFEPAERTFQELLVNCKTNPELPIQPLQIALDIKERKSVFHYNLEDSGWSRLIAPQNSSKDSNVSSVITKTLDQVLKGEISKPLKVLKIDTEGFEERILRGAECLLNENKIEFVIAEYHDGNLAEAGSSQFTLRGFMAEKGFDCYVLGGGPTPVFPKFIPPGIKIGGKWVCNLVFARPASLLKFYSHDDVSSFVVPGQS